MCHDVFHNVCHGVFHDVFHDVWKYCLWVLFSQHQTLTQFHFFFVLCLCGKDGGVHPKGTGKKKKQTREEMLEQKQQQDLQNKWFPHARSSAGSEGGGGGGSHYVQPIRLPDVYGGASVVAVAAGSWHSMCLTNRGIVSKVYVWGRAVEGQLGNGTEGTHVGKGSKRRASNAWSANVVPSLSGLHIRR